MLLLVLVVLLNTYIAALFKLFGRFGVNAFAAIVLNYVICVATGSVVLGYFPITAATLQAPWFPWTTTLGAAFIALFNLLSWCTRHYGIAPAATANKLSLVIPAAVALAFFPEEQFRWTTIAGMVLALPAVYLATRGDGAPSGQKGNTVGWGIVWLFLGSGLLDTGVTLLTRRFFRQAPDGETLQAIASVHIFAMAALLGVLLLGRQLAAGRLRLRRRDVLGGVLLGIPNYFSIYLFLKLLSEGPMQPSVAVPVANISIVVASVLTGMLLFRESAKGGRWLGLALAVAAIGLLSFSHLFP